MCGRYVTISKVAEIEKRFGVTVAEPEMLRQNANVSAGQLAPVITDQNPNALQFFYFGFTPSWASKRMYVLNARSEGDQNASNDPLYSGAKAIISKPMFRASIRSKRCLVIADAFIEGPEKEKLSKPYCVYASNASRPFAFAGIWDEWTNTSTGEIIKSFAIITTVASGVLQAIGHHRSPVILDRESEKLWLDNSLPLGDVTSLLKPNADDLLNAYPISPEIKHPNNNALQFLKPAGERVRKEYDYVLYESLGLVGMGASPARQRRLFEDD